MSLVGQWTLALSDKTADSALNCKHAYILYDICNSTQVASCLSQTDSMIDTIIRIMMQFSCWFSAYTWVSRWNSDKWIQMNAHVRVFFVLIWSHWHLLDDSLCRLAWKLWRNSVMFSFIGTSCWALKHSVYWFHQVSVFELLVAFSAV